MTFAELKSKYSWMEIKKSDWHKHKNGGAWIYKDAQINKDVYIGENAVVWGGTIKGGTIYDGTIEGGTIEGGTIWGGTIKGGTIKGGTIKGGTIWGGTIWGGTWKVQPLFICGSMHTLTNSKPGFISIGCECHEFAWWLERFEAVGRQYRYTPEQIAEYGEYIKLFAKIGK